VHYAWYGADEIRDGNVQIGWSTTFELDTLGFIVLRYDSRDAPPEQINRGLVPATGSGSTYRVVDELKGQGIDSSLFYQVVEITVDGWGDMTPLFGVRPNTTMRYYDGTGPGWAETLDGQNAGHRVNSQP